VAAPSARRPLPALVFLLGLSLLTALVWWRVIHRADAESSPTAAPTTCAAKPSATLLPQPANVTLQVLNSTQTAGLAAKTKTSLTALGFVVAATANDDSGLIPGVAEIRFGPAGTSGASLVAYYLPGATLVNTGRADAQVVVSLGQKFTAPATAAVAKAAMAAAHVTQAPLTKAPTTPAKPVGTAKVTGTAAAPGTTKATGTTSTTGTAKTTVTC
jgi:hypothetical protein